MLATRRQHRTDWTKIMTLAGAAIAAAIGAAVVFGWTVGSEPVIALRKNAFPVQFNTAIGFLACSLALLAALCGRRWVATAAASSVAVLAGTTGLKLVTGVPLPTHHLFLNRIVGDHISGDMAPNTVVAFLCVTTAIVLLGWRERIVHAPDVAASLSAFVVAVGSVALTGYVADIPTAYEWRPHQPIAVLTTIAFLAVGVGTLALAWREPVEPATTSWLTTSHADRRRWPRWLPVPLFVLLMSMCAMLAKSMWDTSRIAIVAPVRHSLIFSMALMLVFGAGVSIALVAVLRLAQTTQRRARELETLNRSLDAEIENRHQQQRRAEELNRALRVVSAGDQAIAHCQDEPDLLQRICDVAVHLGGYRLAWVGFADQDPGHMVRIAAKAGDAAGYIADGFVTWADEPRGRGPTGRAIRSASTTGCDDLLADPSFLPWRDRALAFGFRSTLVVPLLHSGKAFGAMSLYASQAHAFHQEERHLFEQLAQDLTLGIETIRTRQAQQRAEAALAASEERYRSLTVATAQVVWTTGPNGMVDGDMPAWREFTGATVEQLQGCGWLDSLHPDDRERTMRAWSNAVQRREPYEAEYRLLSRDGEYRHMWVRGVPVRNVDGSIREWIGACTDITERKQAETKLALQAELLEMAPVGLFVRDPDNRITYWSHGAEQLYGWTKEEAIGRVTHELLETRFPAPLDEIEAILLQDGVWEGELIHGTRDGRRIVTASRWAARRGPDRVVSGYLEVNVDATARKRAEEERAKYAAELERSNTELQEFAFVASHDLQEPLRKITAFSERLRERAAGSLDETSLDYMNRMHNAAVRMSTLINSLLDYSRVTTRALPFVEVDLASLMVGILADLDQRRLESGARIVVHPLPNVHGDPTQLRQLFQNLLANALKFHNQGVPPEIHVRSEAKDGRWRVSVSDDGIGFDVAYTEKIFKPFQRLHGRSEYEGSGMGLAICRKIAQRHGADIEVNSAPGRGATFTVSLPPFSRDSNDGEINQTGDQQVGRNSESHFGVECSCS